MKRICFERSKIFLRTVIYASWILLPLIASSAGATQPPEKGGRFPDAYFDRARVDLRAFTYKRALHDVAARAIVARAAMRSPILVPLGLPGTLSIELGKVLGASDGDVPSTKVQGVRNIPVLPTTFAGANGSPYMVNQLQRELFDGPWPTGTMTEYYKEISSGALTVTGIVRPWAQLPHPSSYYEGDLYMSPQGTMEPCKGLCRGSRMSAFISDTLAANKNIDWGDFDNDGPDGIPNSGDDDGFVDFVAFVQGEIGGECSEAGKNHIWSHRYSLSSLGATAYTTSSKKKGGGFIAIDDYVVMPALACDNATMIQIGVFAHEFGHAFGLPDLYDTDNTNGKSAGLGTWCLMASGSWGGRWKPSRTPLAHVTMG